MQKEIIILDEDKAYARRRIAQLQKAIQDLGPEFHEVFSQSSETWHDNAPFDALRDRQALLDAELQQLRTLLRSSLLTVPKQKKGVVGIGSSVRLESERGDIRRYFVAGDWTPYAGQTKDGVTIISCNTPLAKQLLGKKTGNLVVIGRATFYVSDIS